MGLYPLEFSECYLDSPSFRERVRAHEAELEKTSRFIKELLKDGKNLISATKQLGLAQRRFAECLGEFQFEYIGDAKTDDEKCIDESLQEFSAFLKNLEDQRELMVSTYSIFEERKKYEKETEKYYSALEKLLTMSAKKKDQQLQEADVQVEGLRERFQEESLEYVCKLQEIQERKKFECVEPMLAFFQTVFTFYHQGYELAKDFDHYKRALQINIQNTRSRFEGTRSEVEDLMRKFKEAPQEQRQRSPISIEGYLYVQEKRPPPFGSSWVKRYCTYVKEQKLLHMVTFDHRSGGKIGETESVILKSCSWKTTEALDRRFCLDIEITDRPGMVLTVQALSEEDRKFWMQAMGGKEPVSWTSLSLFDAQLDEVGFSFVKKCINAIEKRGCQNLRFHKLHLFLILALNINTHCIYVDIFTFFHLADAFLQSSIHLREQYNSRVQAIHHLVHQLPEKNCEMLGLLMRHLANVAANSKKNMMTVANLGVVFGPTLMRPQEETVAAIMELKFQNVVVEILIEQHEKVFGHSPSASPSADMPAFRTSTRQSKRHSRQNRPLAVYNPQVLEVKAGEERQVANSHSVTCIPVPEREITSQEEILLVLDSRRGSLFSVTNRKAKAVYSCEAEHESELSFRVGAIFDDVTFSREPGWLEGRLEGKRGLIPQNYVEML
uniref:Rho GTPase activating protein 10 n=1 Tax=Scleropages formosus TaxID=113540 RepID=A0A8D0CI50_SCLFO